MTFTLFLFISFTLFPNYSNGGAVWWTVMAKYWIKHIFWSLFLSFPDDVPPSLRTDKLRKKLKSKQCSLFVITLCEWKRYIIFSAPSYYAYLMDGCSNGWIFSRGGRDKKNISLTNALEWKVYFHMTFLFSLITFIFAAVWWVCSSSEIYDDFLVK